MTGLGLGTCQPSLGLEFLSLCFAPSSPPRGPLRSVQTRRRASGEASLCGCNNSNTRRSRYLRPRPCKPLLIAPPPPLQRGDTRHPAAPGGGGPDSAPARQGPEGVSGEAPSPLRPTEGEAAGDQEPPGRAAPAVHSAAAAGLPPARRPAPPPACQEADGRAHVRRSCGARQRHARRQGRRPVPSDNQRRQTWPVPWAPGHRLGRSPSQVSPSSDQAALGQAWEALSMPGWDAGDTGPALTSQSPSTSGFVRTSGMGLTRKTDGEKPG